MKVLEITPGLWYWTARCESINADVGCVYFESTDGVVLIDPLVPPEDEARFWAALDRDVARAGSGGVHVLITSPRHERSTEQLAARYGARVCFGVEDEDNLPDGVVAFASSPAGEAAFWLPDRLTLVCGDMLQANDRRQLVVSGEVTRAAAETLIGLGAERVVVSHGEPVLSGGEDALRAAFGRLLEEPGAPRQNRENRLGSSRAEPSIRSGRSST